jgi:hypothetical protein
MPSAPRFPSQPNYGLSRHWLEWGLRLVALLVLGSWVLIAVAHVDDKYALDHTAGSWLALARYVNEGVLYPPLYDGTAFGGTRFMPLQFVLHAGVAQLTGEYLVSGKLIAYAGAVVLLAVAFGLARRLSGSPILALGLVAGILVTPAGLLAATSVRGDALPVALQLGAVTLATRSSRRATAAAAFVSAIAILSKSSALWGALAIIVWLATRERRRLPLFLGCLAIVLGGGLVLFELLSSGRMSDNIVGLSSAGLSGPLSIADDGLRKFASYAERYADAVWLLIPLALVGLLSALSRRRLTIYHLSFLIALPLVVAELADTGVSWNHLIDIEVLTAIVVAELCGSATGHVRPFVQTIVMISLVWGIATAFQVQERHDVVDAARALVGKSAKYPSNPRAGAVGRDDVVLSEDPYFPVSLDQDPVVLDPFMLLRILRDHHDWSAELVGRIQHGRFTKIVLSRRLDPADRWWHDYHFGSQVTNSIANSYRVERRIGRYWIYTPKPGTRRAAAKLAASRTQDSRPVEPVARQPARRRSHAGSLAGSPPYRGLRQA